MTDVRRGEETPTTDELLDSKLAAVHRSMGAAVHCRLSGSDGPPELRDPDLALTRALTSAFRQIGLATVARLQPVADRESTKPASTRYSRPPQEHELLSHLPATRLKYRCAALEAARTVEPQELRRTAGEAVSCAQQLSFLLSEGERCTEVHGALRKLGRRLEEMIRLPLPSRQRAALAGPDYLEAVRAHLAAPAARIVSAARSIRRLMEPELLSCLEHDDEDSMSQAWLGAAEVAQDIADDLARLATEAEQLAQVAATVEQASNDFCGADLRNARLHGVPLDGVLWDLGTEWPEDWERHIRESSVPTDGMYGVLVIEHPTAIRSDA